MQCRLTTRYLERAQGPRMLKNKKKSVVCLFTTPYLDRARGPYMRACPVLHWQYQNACLLHQEYQDASLLQHASKELGGHVCWRALCSIGSTRVCGRQKKGNKNKKIKIKQEKNNKTISMSRVNSYMSVDQSLSVGVTELISTGPFTHAKVFLHELVGLFTRTSRSL